MPDEREESTAENGPEEPQDDEAPPATDDQPSQTVETVPADDETASDERESDDDESVEDDAEAAGETDSAPERAAEAEDEPDSARNGDDEPVQDHEDSSQDDEDRQRQITGEGLSYGPDADDESADSPEDTDDGNDEETDDRAAGDEAAEDARPDENDRAEEPDDERDEAETADDDGEEIDDGADEDGSDRDDADGVNEPLEPGSADEPTEPADEPTEPADEPTEPEPEDEPIEPDEPIRPHEPPAADETDDADGAEAASEGSTEQVPTMGGGGLPADDAGGISTPPGDQEMPLADHIEEMISRLAIVLLIGAAGTAIGILWASDAIAIIWADAIPQAEEWPPHIYHPLELWLTRIKVAGLLGIMVALPMFVYQCYLFMRPGLYPHERKYYLAAVPTSVVLAAIGMVFSYLLVLPILFHYFTFYSEGSAEIHYALGETFNLVITLTAFLAIVFQIPLLIMMAIMMGVTTRRWLADKRLYFWAAFAGLAFAFTIDPTAMAAGLVAITMILLFEGTLALLKWAGVD